jgi:hypothetical protein
MATTLKQEAALIHRILNGGQANTDSEYDDRYTAKLFRSAMNEILGLQYIQSRQLADDRTHIKMYVATYPSINVKWDDATERCYADLPDFYISLPYNRGVVQVSSMDKPLEPMIQKRNPSVSAKLPAGRLQGQIGYYVEGLKIFWDEKVTKKGVKKVLVKLVVAAPDSFGLDDSLPITPEQAAQCRDRVLNWYRNEGIQDKVVDGNKDLGVKIQDRE